MAGLYQRKTSSLQASPGMSVTPSPGAGAAVPSGAPLSVDRQSFDPSALGGLLGLIQRSGGASSAQGAGNGTSGVFNASLMPGAGRDLSLGSPSAGNFGPGVPSALSGSPAAPAPASSAAQAASSGALQTALSPLGAEAPAQGAASSSPASGGPDFSSLAFILGSLGGAGGR